MPSTEAPYLGRNTKSPYTRGEILRQRVWHMVQSTLFRFSLEKMHAYRAWLLKCFGADIPETKQVVIFPTAKVYFPWRLRLEPRSMVGRNVNLYNLDQITLRRGANVSQGCHLCAGSHDFNLWDMPLTISPITIGENAWIAADVFIGPGVEVGELSVVGARAVVVKSQPAHHICVGNPCRPVKDRPRPMEPDRDLS